MISRFNFCQVLNPYDYIIWFQPFKQHGTPQRSWQLPCLQRLTSTSSKTSKTIINVPRRSGASNFDQIIPSKGGKNRYLIVQTNNQRSFSSLSYFFVYNRIGTEFNSSWWPSNNSWRSSRPILRFLETTGNGRRWRFLINKIRFFRWLCR